MRILIQKQGENIQTFTDFSDIEERGEIAHFISELEVIKKELLDLWEDFENEEEQ